MNIFVVGGAGSIGSHMVAMLAHGVKRFIFSSTAAIFGEPECAPIDEKHPKRPIDPYGRTKLMVEEALADFDRACGLESVCLRYFNAAGADPLARIGGRHDPEIPGPRRVCRGRRSMRAWRAALRRGCVRTIFGPYSIWRVLPCDSQLRSSPSAI